jgi:hypothetical protein
MLSFKQLKHQMLNILLLFISHKEPGPFAIEVRFQEARNANEE